MSLSERINSILKPLDALVRIILTLFLLPWLSWSLPRCSFAVLAAPIPWAEESARFMFAWVAFLGASVAVKNKSHTGVELFASYLPRRRST